jgi:hypothetical protein
MPQGGHSKSPNSTIVTGADRAPREGAPAVGTSTAIRSGRDRVMRAPAPSLRPA